MHYSSSTNRLFPVHVANNLLVQIKLFRFDVCCELFNLWSVKGDSKGVITSFMMATKLTPLLDVVIIDLKSSNIREETLNCDFFLKFN